jgi:hypothetical protein
MSERNIPQASSSASQHSDLEVFALCLVIAIKKVLEQQANLIVSREPVLHKRAVIQFQKRMRVDALEKFNERTVFSTVHFYRDKAAMEKGVALGNIIVYIPVNNIVKLFEKLNYPPVDEDDDAAVLDASGTLVNLFAGAFVKDMAARGYGFLVMSHFESYINVALNGIDFSSDQEYKYEIDFEIRGQRVFVVELTMGAIGPAR